LNNDFRDILSIFIAEGVEFLLVGAYALAVHGVARATGDIDLWVRVTPENAVRVWNALAKFGAPVAGLTNADLMTPGLIFQIGVAPRRIDVITSIDGVGFDEAWAARSEVTVEGISLTVIGREDLIRNKRAAGRPKDLADLALLEESEEPGSSV
jgi:predicted nucleotidyltransferase